MFQSTRNNKASPIVRLVVGWWCPKVISYLGMLWSTASSEEALAISSNECQGKQIRIFLAKQKFCFHLVFHIYVNGDYSILYTRTFSPHVPVHAVWQVTNIYSELRKIYCGSTRSIDSRRLTNGLLSKHQMFSSLKPHLCLKINTVCNSAARSLFFAQIIHIILINNCQGQVPTIKTNIMIRESKLHVVEQRLMARHSPCSTVKFLVEAFFQKCCP